MTSNPGQAGPSLDLPGACPATDTSADLGVAWHYGDPHAEQRTLLAGAGIVDLSHHGVVRVTGPDRLTWLHDLTTGWLRDLPAGASALALILDPHGHVEHELHVVDDGTSSWLMVEPGTAADLIAYLDSMRFLLRVEVSDAASQWAVLGLPEIAQPPEQALSWLMPAEWRGTGHTDAGSDAGGDASRYVPQRPDVMPVREILVPRTAAADLLTGDLRPVGTWAWEALRVAAAIPRLNHETDHRTLPHEVGWVGPAVHLAKGCYRGQEAVARVHNLGRPPRRLVLLHLDGSLEQVPAHADPVRHGGRDIGWVASVARHHELGPIATAVIRRSTPIADPLAVGPVSATQEVVVAG